MLLLDVNVLVYAHREDAPNHPEFSQWLQQLVNSDQAYGISDIVLSGFIRIVTHPKVFSPPSSIDQAVEFAQILRSQQNAVVISPGSRHWDIFCRLCKDSTIKGNLVPDAFLAALAIETGSEWITTDHDYRRFQGLRTRHPFQ